VAILAYEIEHAYVTGTLAVKKKKLDFDALSDGSYPSEVSVYVF